MKHVRLANGRLVFDWNALLCVVGFRISTERSHTDRQPDADGFPGAPDVQDHVPERLRPQRLLVRIQVPPGPAGEEVNEHAKGPFTLSESECKCKSEFFFYLCRCLMWIGSWNSWEPSGSDVAFALALSQCKWALKVHSQASGFAFTLHVK